TTRCNLFMTCLAAVSPYMSLVLKRPDQAGRGPGMTIQRLDQFVARQSRLERCGLEIGCDQRKGVVVRCARRSTRSRIVTDFLRAVTADILVALLGDLAFREPGDRHR